ncbi:MAG: TetR/AcrR family transcriptional regulator [bacterium]|nr:MAG: TetR/AcrR family transcriptional regulator [bacterium]
MSYQEPDFLKTDDNKGKIFRAAAKLFAEKGYNGVSMREISERTGLSKPTIYYYFGNKEGIYTSLVATSLNYNVEIFQDIQQRDISTKQKIIELVKLRFHQVLEYPDLAKFFIDLLTGTEKLPFLEQLMKEADDRRKMLVDLINDGISNGEFGSSAKPELASEIFIGSLMHFIHKQLNTSEVILSDELAEEIVELLFLGWNE